MTKNGDKWFQIVSRPDKRRMGVLNMSLNLPILKEVNIICPNCRRMVSMNISIAEIVPCNIIETCMGVETKYDFTAEAECRSCHHRFATRGEVTEYPDGNLYDVGLTED